MGTETQSPLSLGRVLTVHRMATTNKSWVQTVNQRETDWVEEGIGINLTLVLRDLMDTG